MQDDDYNEGQEAGAEASDALRAELDGTNLDPETEASGFDVAPAIDRPEPPLPPKSPHAIAKEKDLYAPHELERRQLSMSGLLIVMTAVSVGLAPISFLPVEVYAAVLGVLIFLLFILAGLLGARELIVRVTLISLLVVYAITMLVALLD